MSLTLVAVPIGNIEDITLRALKILKSAELIIAEEHKPLFQLFKSLDLPRPEKHELLNEHSQKHDIDFLLKECEHKKVVLITDCGTPGFCDPGAELVMACRKKKIPVTSIPGASSLMMILSLSGIDLKEFYFRGFIPAKKELREKELLEIKKSKIPVVLMDTPYRFQTTLEDLKRVMPDKLCTLGMDLTADSEKVIQVPCRELKAKSLPDKSEFILIVS